MASDNKTQIIISAEDRTGAGLASAKAGFQEFSAAIAGLKSLAVVGIAASLTDSVKSLIDLGDEMNDLSQRVGISVKDLGTWTLAAAQSGTTMESLARGVKGLSTFIVENGDALRKAGITATDANGALIQLADLFKVLPDGVEKTALVVKIFGRAGLDLIPVLNQGSAGLQEAADKAKVYGERLALLAPAADKFNDQMAEMALHSKELGFSIANSLLPGLTGLTEFLNDLTAGGDRTKLALEWLSEDSSLSHGLIGVLLRGGLKEADLFGKGLALAGVGGDESRRTASGNIVGGAGYMAAFDAAGAQYMADREAKQRALGLLGKGPQAAAAGKAPKIGGYTDYEMRISQAVSGAIQGSAVVKARELADQIERLDSLFFDSGLEADVYASALEKVTGMTAKAGDESKRLDELLAATPSAQLEKSRKDMQLLVDALKAGEIGEALFAEAAQTRLGQLGDTIKEVDNFARDMGLSFSSAFEDTVIGGKKASEVLSGLARDIERIILRKTITEPLGNAVADSIKGGDGLWGGVKSLFGFAAGGSFTVGGAGGTDSQVVAFRATPGETVSIATPAQRGGGGITVNIIEDSARAGQTQARQSSGGGNILDVFVEQVRATVASDIARGGGPIANAMASTYGLNRAAGAY